MFRMKSGLATILAGMVFLATAPAQELVPDITYIGPDGSPVDGIRCATVDTGPDDLPRAPENMQQWLLEHPEFSEGTIYVPVAFHVVTANNGITGNVPDDQIQRQIDTLNAGFEGTGFAFYLSSIDRTANDSWFYNTMTFDGQMKAALAIDPAHHLNLYTASIGGGILGYAYLPWQFPETSTQHGVVVLYSSLPGGSSPPYNLGATATHEVGHYLGLYHTFEGGCSPPGDEVDDTPYEASPAFGCPAGRNTCANEPEPDPIHNYMDYTDDACMWEMTQGQADRMDWAVNTYKPGLLNAAAIPNPPADVLAYSDHTIPTTIEVSWVDPTNLVNGDTLLPGYFHIHLLRDGELIDSVAGGTELYVDTGLNEGEDYVYDLFARIDSNGFESEVVSVTGTAGGSRIPGTPLAIGISGNQNEVTLFWINPSTNIDGSPLLDFGGIRLYRDGLLAEEFSRAEGDTGSADSASYTPPVPGSYGWYLTAIDNDVPLNESPPTETLLTPLHLPLTDPFTDEGAPNPDLWITVNGEVNTRANNPPSPPYALNLNGQPIGGDTVEMNPIDLRGLDGSGIVFSYQYQPQGNGNAPEAGDSLQLFFRNDLGSWVKVAAFAGSSLQPFQTDVIEIVNAPNGGGSYFHSQFRVRFTSKGSAGSIPNDDWFVDNVYLGLPAPAIAASTDSVVFDTTMVGATATATVEIYNLGLEELIITDIVATLPAAFSVDTTSFSILPGETFAVGVTFAPDQIGALSGSLEISSNDPGQGVLAIFVSGVGDLPVAAEEVRTIPREFSVSPNYPNPFNPSTTIRYGLPHAASVDLVIYDMLGGRVRTLVKEEQEAGFHDVLWDGTNDRGVPVTSGVYVYRFVAGEYQMMRKMILIK